MEREFFSAFVQDTAGREGFQDLIHHWYNYAARRELANMARLTRSPALHNVLDFFFDQEKVKNLSFPCKVLFKRSFYFPKYNLFSRMSGTKSVMEQPWTER